MSTFRTLCWRSYRTYSGDPKGYRSRRRLRSSLSFKSSARMLLVSPSGSRENRTPFGARSSPFGFFVSGEALMVIIAIG